MLRKNAKEMRPINLKRSKPDFLEELRDVVHEAHPVAPADYLKLFCFIGEGFEGIPLNDGVAVSQLSCNSVIEFKIEEPPKLEVCLRIKHKELEYDDASDLLGRGKTSEVFRAKYKGRNVAVKRLFARMDESMVPVLQKEVAVFALLRHPNVASLYGVSLESNLHAAVVLELLEGGSLHNLLFSENGPKMDLTNRMKLLTQIARGLCYMHSKRVIHKDVKPSNILLDNSKQNAKLIDFGIGVVAQSLLPSAPTFHFGTPEYSAPEVFEGTGLSQKLDCYAFGLTIWTTVTCKRPFAECQSMMQIMFTVAKGNRPSTEELDAQTKELVEKLWQGDPDKRPSMEEVLRVMDKDAEKSLKEIAEAVEEKCVQCKSLTKANMSVPCGHLQFCELCCSDDKKGLLCPVCKTPMERFENFKKEDAKKSLMHHPSMPSLPRKK